MRTVWRKDRNAVSPVIATILMVAVTVVLAAVLYVMVVGFEPQQDLNPPQASLNADEGRLVLTTSRSYDIGDDTLQVIIDNGPKMDIVAGIISGTVSFVDTGDDGKIGSNDYFENSASETSLIKIIWTSGDVSQVIAEGEI